jgi:F0F1-type ATP synthase membrane subunit c/vacuolar-type H+-ATPase subunit K
MPNGKPIKVEYQTLLVTWLALLMSQIVFLVVAYVIKPELWSSRYLSATFSELAGPKPLIIIVFAASALVFFLLSQAIARQHMRRAVRDRDATCLQTGLVIGCALSEISSILGLMLAIFWQYPYFYLWIALGTLGILMNFPRRSNLTAAAFDSTLK